MRTTLAPLGIVCLALATGAGSAAQSGEEFARRQYESGLAFMQNARYAEALKDFQIVIDSFGQSDVADDALLQVALYHLEIARDLPAAQEAADRLLREYPNSDSAPMAYVIGGRLTIARGRAPADVDTALASFERVPRLFPGSEAIAAARFYAGETLRLVRRIDEALDRFHRVATEYPRSPWAARADLASAPILVASDRGTQAFPRLQRIRQQFPGTREASTALRYNTMLYRLYVRPKPQLPYAFSGRFVGSEGSRFRDVIGVLVDDMGRILLGHKQGIAVFDETGSMVRSISAADPSAFFVEQRTRIVTVRRDTIVPDGASAIPIGTPVPGKLPRPVEDIPSVVVLSNGDRIMVDRRARNVIRVPQDARLGTAFSPVNADRLAVNELDDVAMIDRDSKGIVIADRTGRTLTTIPAKGPDYQFSDPVDVAFDPLGHVFVLDGRKPAIYVFGARNRLIAAITGGGREAGALQRPRAFALDHVGRLLVFDDGAQRIQVYQ